MTTQRVQMNAWNVLQSSDIGKPQIRIPYQTKIAFHLHKLCCVQNISLKSSQSVLLVVSRPRIFSIYCLFEFPTICCLLSEHV